jgi:hypothetical protein
MAKFSSQINFIPARIFDAIGMNLPSWSAPVPF